MFVIFSKFSIFDILKPIVIHLYNKYGIETILEIGFNIGHSATLFLDYCPDKKSKVTSVDLGIHKDTIKASEAVKGHFGDRFRFHLLNSKYMENTLKHDTFDLAFSRSLSNDTFGEISKNI